MKTARILLKTHEFRFQYMFCCLEAETPKTYLISLKHSYTYEVRIYIFDKFFKIIKIFYPQGDVKVK